MQIIEKRVGEGSCGLIKQVKIEDNVYAIKQMNNINGKKEYKIHQLLKHPNILNFIQGNEDYIVTELMIQNDLLDFVIYAGSLSVNSSTYILKQLVEALKYMHQLRIAHRDVKLDNLLLDGQNYQIKLCDFDASVSLDEGKVQNQVGTYGYLAPEITPYGMIDALNLQECDIFSLGVCYYILLFGQFPFKSSDQASPLYKLILQNKWDRFWHISQRNRAQKIPPFCLELIQGMIESDPKKRFTLDEILNRIGQINEQEYINEMHNIYIKLQQNQ